MNKWHGRPARATFQTTVCDVTPDDYTDENKCEEAAIMGAQVFIIFAFFMFGLCYLCLGNKLFVRILVLIGILLCCLVLIPNMERDDRLALGKEVVAFTGHLENLMNDKQYENVNRDLTRFNADFYSLIQDSDERHRFVSGLIAQANVTNSFRHRGETRDAIGVGILSGHRDK